MPRARARKAPIVPPSTRVPSIFGRMRCDFPNKRGLFATLRSRYTSRSAFYSSLPAPRRGQSSHRRRIARDRETFGWKRYVDRRFMPESLQNLRTKTKGTVSMCGREPFFFFFHLLFFLLGNRAQQFTLTQT